MESSRVTSFERLAGAHNLSRNTRDAERWTAEEWLKLYDAYKACDWDLTPCQWHPEQVAAVLSSGTVPRFNDDQSPELAS